LDNGFAGYMITAVSEERVDVLLEKERQFMTCRAILEDRERLVLDMLTEGFSPRHIAEMLGVKLSSCYVIIHRLRRKFQNILSEKNAAQAG
jgi:DNA-directed RNA polymerase specialized sigma24 family protein